MTAPVPGGATRSGTSRRMQAPATTAVDRPANSVSIPARPGSIPKTRQTLPAATRTILTARAAPRFPAPRTPGPLRLRHSGQLHERFGLDIASARLEVSYEMTGQPRIMNTSDYSL